MPLEQVRDLACELRACQLQLHDQNEELTRTQRDLKESLNRYQELFDRAPVGYLTLVPECEIRETNRAAAALFGWEKPALIGAAFSDFVSPRDVAKFKQHMTRICHEQGAHSQEIEFVRSGGDTFVAVVESVAVRDSAGQPRQCRMALVDVTERVRAQAELQRSERLLRTIIDATAEAMILVGADGVIGLFNSAAERMFGYSRDEVIGAPIERLISERFRGDDLERLGDCLAAGRSGGAGGFVCETTGLRRDGTEFPVELSRASGRGEDGPFVIALARDLTERKRVERERSELDARIQEAQKFESMGTLAGGVAHDFSNLLVGVLGNASLALAETPANSHVAQLLKRIERAARSAADLTRQLLAYSGRGSFVVGPLGVSTAVRDMSHLLRSSVSKKAELIFDLADDDFLIEADASQVRQMVMNLTINASEALGDAPGVITIKSGVLQADRERLSSAVLGDGLPAGEYVFLSVTDTGHGMDEDTKSRIFDPFYTTKFAGRGLGLAAVLGIARSQRGAIDVDSRLGRGTVVTVLFPRWGVEDEPSNAAAPSACQGVVLVVDDEDAVRLVVREALERAGYSVRLARDGREALRLFQEDQDAFDAVILDVTMPELDGVETLRGLRAGRADLPVILSSGYDHGDIVERLGEAGPSAFLQKPYSPATLLDQLRAVLA